MSSPRFAAAGALALVLVAGCDAPDQPTPTCAPGKIVSAAEHLYAETRCAKICTTYYQATTDIDCSNASKSYILNRGEEFSAESRYDDPHNQWILVQ